MADSKACFGLKAAEPARYFTKRRAALLLRVAKSAVSPLTFSVA